MPEKDPPLSPEEIAVLRKKLAEMSITGIRDMYHATHYRCQLDGSNVPLAREIQKLVQVWKEMRRWSL
jgi:hypothetical protein